MSVKDEEKYVCKKAKACKYSVRLGVMYACSYSTITGFIRGGYCSECTVFEPKGKRKENIE